MVQNRRVLSCGSLNQADRCENGRVRGKTGAEPEGFEARWSDFGERSGRALSEGKSLPEGNAYCLSKPYYCNLTAQMWFAD